MTSEVLSSARLLRIINEFSLYSSQRGKVEPSTLVALMRNNIELQPLNKNPERRSGSAFMIAFTADNPQVAQQVVTRLTSLFIEESQQSQEDHDAGMTNFLESELAAAQEDLAQQESVLRDYKMKNLGQLPEQEQGNLDISDWFANPAPEYAGQPGALATATRLFAGYALSICLTIVQWSRSTLGSGRADCSRAC